jgi:hypothetical protein
MLHPHALESTEWLVSWLKSDILHITLTDLLDFDHTYPGVLKDVDTIIWQLELTKAQSKSEK